MIECNQKESEIRAPIVRFIRKVFIRLISQLCHLKIIEVPLSQKPQEQIVIVK